MNSRISEKDFIDMLVNRFPEIKEEVLDEDYEGLLTLQVGCFKRFTQEAIDNNDFQRVSASFEFVNEIGDKVIQKVENALYIFYLGHLTISKGSKVEKMLPDKLKKAYQDIHKHNSSLSQNSKLNKFLEDL
jgi:tRNA A37 threonylcarbamoyltransferase TsaD